MKITEAEVRAVANLANLSVGEQELHRLAKDVDHMLEYIDQLGQLDTTHVEPMAQVLYDAEPTATLRADIERPTLSNEEALRNAAESGLGMFKVPKVIER